MKEISSNSSAETFRSYSVIIIILICIVSFFSFTDHLSEKAENIARDQVVSDISYSLAMMLYDYTIKGQQKELRKFHKDNPFILLAIYRSLPSNYHGTVSELSGQKSTGWYFDRSQGRAIYQSNAGQRLFYQMVYTTKGGVGRLVLEIVEALPDTLSDNA